jgi:hypothetical protein
VTSSTEVILGVAVLAVLGPFAVATCQLIGGALRRRRAQIPAAILETRGAGARYLARLVARIHEWRYRHVAGQEWTDTRLITVPGVPPPIPVDATVEDQPPTDYDG